MKQKNNPLEDMWHEHGSIIIDPGMLQHVFDSPPFKKRKRNEKEKKSK